MNTVVAASLRDPGGTGIKAPPGAVLETNGKTVVVGRQRFDLDHVFTQGGTNEVCTIQKAGSKVHS